MATQDDDALSLSKRDEEDLKQALSGLGASSTIDADLPKSATDVQLVAPETTVAVAPSAALLSANPFGEYGLLQQHRVFVRP